METSRLRDLCLAGVVCVFSLVGNIAYFGALYALLLFIFVVASFLCVRPDWRAMLRPRRQDVLWLLLLLAMAGLYLYFAAHMLDQIHSCPENRDPGSSHVPLQQFLADGTGIGLWKFRELTFPMPGRDFTFYIGFLPLVFIGYALVRSRQSRLAIFLIPTIYLSLLSAGGTLPIAAWTYWWFPPIRWFHYIGQIAGLLRFLFIVCAGFGLDQFLTDMEREPAGSSLWSSRVMLLILTVLLVSLGCWCHSALKPMLNLSWSRIYPILLTLSVFSGLALAFIPVNLKRWAGVAAALFLTLDLCIFQHYIIQGWHCRWTSLDSSAARVRPYSFQSQRSAGPDFGTDAYHAQRAVECHPTQRCSIEASQFIQFDPGWWGDKYLNIFWGESVDHLLKARWQLTPQWENRGLIFYALENLDLETAAMGWQAPKIRLVAGATYAPDAETAGRLVAEADIDHAPVLETDPPEGGGQDASEAAEDDWGQLDVLSFTFNRLEARARVTRPRGAWLYYADAYHPGWKATVNGVPAPVVRANLAFKAVRLGEGQNRVRLVYSDGLRGAASVAIALTSLVFAAALLFAMLISACRVPIRFRG